MSKDEISVPKKLEACCEDMIHLCDAIGDFIQVWGFKRVHGQVWALLYLCSRPRTPTEIALELKISKTLVTFTLTDLEAYGLIQSEQLNNDKKKKYFSATNDAFQAIMQVLRTREMKILERAQQEHSKLKQKVDALPADEKQLVATDRFVVMGAMIEGALGALKQITKQDSLDIRFLSMLAQLYPPSDGQT